MSSSRSKLFIMLGIPRRAIHHSHKSALTAPLPHRSQVNLSVQPSHRGHSRAGSLIPRSGFGHCDVYSGCGPLRWLTNSPVHRRISVPLLHLLLQAFRSTHRGGHVGFNQAPRVLSSCLSPAHIQHLLNGPLLNRRVVTVSLFRVIFDAEKR